MRSAFLFALIVSIGACGDSAGPPAAAAVALVSVTPDSTGVVLYDSFPLHATARDAHGNVLPNREAIWSSSAWGIVWVRSNGVVQPLGRGGATITATIDGVQGDAMITVVVPINFIQLMPSATTVPVGDTLRIRTTLFSKDGLPPTDSAVTWSSNDTTVAKVVAGLVTGRQAGSTTIIAAAPGAAAAAAVRVIPHVASVTVSPSDTSVNVSDIVSFVTIAFGPTGDTLSQWQNVCTGGCRLDYPVALRVSDTTVAQLVSCCSVEARAIGVDTIVATVDGVTGRAVLRVSSAASTSEPRARRVN